jgi:hypothetical protein
MTDRTPITPEQVREMADSGDHSWMQLEFLIEEDESQFGTEALREARVELERLFKEVR